MYERNVSRKPSQVVMVLRWIALLPASVGAAWAAWLVVNFGINPGSFISKAFIVTVSHAVMGGAFVFVGVRLTPIHQRSVAFVLAGIGLVGIGMMLFPAIVLRDYWAIWGGVAAAYGVVCTTYSLVTQTNMQ